MAAGVSFATDAKDAKNHLKITAIDVEGGFATLYVTPQGHSLLIDTGWPAGMGGVKPEAGETLPPTPSSAQRIAATVKAAGLKGIDYLLVTHYHVDHVGGAVELMSLIPVGTVLDHGPNREELAPNANPKFLGMAPATLYPKYLGAIGGRPHRVLKPGESLSMDAMKITAVDSDGEVPKSPLGKGGPGANCAAATTSLAVVRGDRRRAGAVRGQLRTVVRRRAPGGGGRRRIRSGGRVQRRRTQPRPRPPGARAGVRRSPVGQRGAARLPGRDRR